MNSRGTNHGPTQSGGGVSEEPAFERSLSGVRRTVTAGVPSWQHPSFGVSQPTMISHCGICNVPYCLAAQPLWHLQCAVLLGCPAACAHTRTVRLSVMGGCTALHRTAVVDTQGAATRGPEGLGELVKQASKATVALTGYGYVGGGSRSGTSTPDSQRRSFRRSGESRLPAVLCCVVLCCAVLCCGGIGGAGARQGL